MYTQVIGIIARQSLTCRRIGNVVGTTQAFEIGCVGASGGNVGGLRDRASYLRG